jgi:TolB-like protein/DNA-binding winged helix-turn-helix (wHTH) protein/cytochrome c-type biogenesis protein CcmH/NrfG
MPVSRRFAHAFGPFRLDPVEKVLYKDDVPVSLTPKAVETLLALVARPGQLVPKEELLQTVWPGTFVEENNLAQHISMLRRVLGSAEDGRPLIETVPKRGYRFVGTVTEWVPPTVRPTAPVAEPAAAAAKARRNRVWAGLAVIAIVLAVLAVRRFSEAPSSPALRQNGQVIRMAVLPFVNLGASDDEYFAAGITEEIISRLATLRQLAVASSTTTTSYDRRGKTARQIGADLGVDYVVEGWVRWAEASAGRQVRITPKLIRLSDDTAVWSHQYDAALSDIFAVQTDIAYQVAGALQVVLEGRERTSVESRSTENTEAYLAYLRGITTFQQGPSDTGTQILARAEFEQAVARDPRFAAAWGWLARVYAWQYNTGAQRSPETRQLARDAADRAIALNPAQPEAHLGLAQVLLLDRDYETALRELAIAHPELPNSPELYRMFGWVELRRGNWGESLAAYNRAFDLDPATTAESLIIYYLHLRDYREVTRFIGVSKAGNRSAATLPEAWVHFSDHGDIAAARRVLEPILNARSPADARVRGLLARFEWMDGRHDRALELIRQMDESGAWIPVNFRFPGSLAAAQVYESMGRDEDARKSYTAAYEELRRRQQRSPEDYQIAAALGLAMAGLGRAEEAVRFGEQAVQLQPVTRDAAEGPLYLYLLAQIHARLAQRAEAFAVLDRMFSLPGFYNERWVEHDPGFANLRSDAAFAAHVARWSTQKGEVLLRKQSPGTR